MISHTANLEVETASSPFSVELRSDFLLPRTHRSKALEYLEDTLDLTQCPPQVALLAIAFGLPGQWRHRRHGQMKYHHPSVVERVEGNLS